MAGKKSNAREKIKLVSTEGTGEYYTTVKNKKNTTDKLIIKNTIKSLEGMLTLKKIKLSKLF